VFVQVDHGVEFISNWRQRHQTIQRYKARCVATLRRDRSRKELMTIPTSHSLSPIDVPEDAEGDNTKMQILLRE
jgi:hypothetical protein